MPICEYIQLFFPLFALYLSVKELSRLVVLPICSFLFLFLSKLLISSVMSLVEPLFASGCTGCHGSQNLYPDLTISYVLLLLVAHWFIIWVLKVITVNRLPIWMFLRCYKTHMVVLYVNLWVGLDAGARLHFQEVSNR